MAADSAPANPPHLTYQSPLDGIFGPKLLLIQQVRTAFNDLDRLQTRLVVVNDSLSRALR